MATKWDYKTVVMTGGFMGRHKNELRRDHLEQQFDLLGADGWELAWILMEQSLHGEKDGHVVIFKRPLPAGSAPVMASESPTGVSVPEVASTAS